MSALDRLQFVKRVPVSAVAKSGKSPLQKAKERLSLDIGYQISLARDPNFEIVTTRKTRGSGEISETRRKPKSWIVRQNGKAFITVRFSNKSMPIGGKRGSVVSCGEDEIIETLSTLRDWAASPEADPMIEKMMAEAKRKPRS